MQSSPRTYLPRPSRREYFTILLLAIELVLFSVFVPNFLGVDNITTVLRNATDLAIISIGMTMVMIMGGIDVSVGSALGIVAIVAAWSIQGGYPSLLIVLIAALAGTAIGVINGSLVTFGRIPDIIATLGMMNLLRAGVFGLLGGQWITGLPPVFGGLTSGAMFGIPSSLYLLAIFYAAFWYLMTFTTFGRHIYAVGNNAEAATLAGINITRTRIFTHMVLGTLVGVASLLYIGRLGSVEITVGQDLAIKSIAAVVIGGTAVTGGRGSVIGTLAGVMFMAFMRNGIVILGVPSLWEQAIVGALVILSATLDIVMDRRTARGRARQMATRGLPPAATLPAHAAPER